MTRTFRICVAYDGTDFAGWQVQPNQPTIQQSLTEALHDVTGELVTVTGSGRTDSGVHAYAQVASFPLQHWRAPAAGLARALNTRLPDSISVHHCGEVENGFHAISDATGKRYRYQIQCRGNRDPFLSRHWWHVTHRLDLEPMRQAVSLIIGKRDFACFQASGAATKTTVRTVRDCRLSVEPPQIYRKLNPCKLLSLEVEADGFLYNMVRNIVGTLIEVGRGKTSVSDFAGILQSKDRNQAGPTAPPHGLHLKWVEYVDWRSDKVFPIEPENRHLEGG